MVVIVGDNHEFSAGAARLAMWALRRGSFSGLDAIALLQKLDEIQRLAGRFIGQALAVEVDGFCKVLVLPSRAQT